MMARSTDSQQMIGDPDADTRHMGKGGEGRLCGVKKNRSAERDY